MKTKVFTKNKDGKIEFTESELKRLLDEIYDDGYNDGKKKCTYTYTTPYRYPYIPYYYTTCNGSNITAGSSTESYTLSTATSSTCNDNTKCSCNNKKKDDNKYTFTYMFGNPNKKSDK